MQNDARQLINDFVNQALDKPALIVGSNFLDGYTQTASQEIIDIHDPSSATEILITDSPIDILGGVCKNNLTSLKGRALKAIDYASEVDGPQKAAALVEAVFQRFSLGRLSLVHDIDFSGRTYINRTAKNTILLQKKLKSPSCQKDGNVGARNATFIYFSALPTSEERQIVKNKTYFVIRNPEEELVRRSLFCVLDRLIGGNHIEVAAPLYTLIEYQKVLEARSTWPIDKYLTGEKQALFDKIDDCNATTSMCHMLAPLEVDLIGHCVIEKGKERQIQPPAKRNIGPRKKKPGLESGGGFQLS